MGSGLWGQDVLGVSMFSVPLCFWTAEERTRQNRGGGSRSCGSRFVCVTLAMSLCFISLSKTWTLSVIKGRWPLTTMGKGFVVRIQWEVRRPHTQSQQWHFQLEVSFQRIGTMPYRHSGHIQCTWDASFCQHLISSCPKGGSNVVPLSLSILEHTFGQRSVLRQGGLPSPAQAHFII